jgi:hypothetical protein
MIWVLVDIQRCCWIPRGNLTLSSFSPQYVTIPPDAPIGRRELRDLHHGDHGCLISRRYRCQNHRQRKQRDRHGAGLRDARTRSRDPRGFRPPHAATPVECRTLCRQLRRAHGRGHHAYHVDGLVNHLSLRSGSAPAVPAAVTPRRRTCAARPGRHGATRRPGPDRCSTAAASVAG